VEEQRPRTGKEPVLRQGFLFLAAGGLNTAFGYAAFAAFLWLTGSKELAVLLGTVAGVAFNFGTYGAVFSRCGIGRLPHFLAFYLAVLGANIAVLRLLGALGMNPYVGQAVFLAFSTPVSFIAMRSLVFPKAARANA
jgi:hypothetical protein